MGKKEKKSSPKNWPHHSDLTCSELLPFFSPPLSYCGGATFIDSGQSHVLHQTMPFWEVCCFGSVEDPKLVAYYQSPAPNQKGGFRNHGETARASPSDMYEIARLSWIEPKKKKRRHYS